MNAIRDSKIAAVKKALLQELRLLVNTTADERTAAQAQIVEYFLLQLLQQIGEEIQDLNAREAERMLGGSSLTTVKR